MVRVNSKGRLETSYFLRDLVNRKILARVKRSVGVWHRLMTPFNHFFYLVPSKAYLDDLLDKIRSFSFVFCLATSSSPLSYNLNTGVSKMSILTFYLHISNIYHEGELPQEATVAKFATVQAEGDRQIKCEIEYDNLDLSKTKVFWWAVKDLNLRPTD